MKIMLSASLYISSQIFSYTLDIFRNKSLETRSKAIVLPVSVYANL